MPPSASAAGRRGASWSVAPAVMGDQRPDLSGDFAAIDDHGEEIRHDEDADAPGESDPDVVTDRLLPEQVADRVDNRRHWLVLGEDAYRARHGGGGHECRANERQEDE